MWTVQELKDSAIAIKRVQCSTRFGAKVWWVQFIESTPRRWAVVDSNIRVDEALRMELLSEIAKKGF